MAAPERPTGSAECRSAPAQRRLSASQPSPLGLAEGRIESLRLADARRRPDGCRPPRPPVWQRAERVPATMEAPAGRAPPRRLKELAGSTRLVPAARCLFTGELLGPVSVRASPTVSRVTEEEANPPRRGKGVGGRPRRERRSAGQQDRLASPGSIGGFAESPHAFHKPRRLVVDDRGDAEAVAAIDQRVRGVEGVDLLPAGVAQPPADGCEADIRRRP